MPVNAAVKDTKRKVEKALNANLQARKDSLEADGYLIKAGSPGFWCAAGEKLTTQFYRRISDVIEVCEEHRARTSKSKPKREFLELDINLFVPSNTAPQAIRRKRFTQENLQELADSIRDEEEGVLVPILARRVEDLFEIVAGERRWRAAQMAGETVIPAVVREMTDAQVIKSQLHENLHREDPHILDEAANYRYMRDGLKYSIERIASEAKKDVSHIEKALRLSDLPDVVKETFERGEIPKNILIEIAKYPPRDHVEIFRLVHNNYGMTSQSLFTFGAAKSRIAQHYLLRLDLATFPLDSRELRPDGLTCPECPERTGELPNLFDEVYTQKDNCLNRTCYESKAARFVQIQKVKAATNILHFPKDVAETKANPVRVITEKHYVPESAVVKENILKADEYTKLEKPDECKYATPAVSADRETAGKTEMICTNPKCPVHGSGKEPAAQVEAPAVDHRQLRRERDELEFIDKVALEVEERIYKASAAQIGEFAPVAAFNGEEYEIQTLTRFWELQLAENDTRGKAIVQILGLRGELTSESYQPFDEYAEQIRRLTPDAKAQLFFMLAHYGGNTDVMILCERFSLNYRLIEAEEAMKLAPPNRTELFKFYLRKVERGETEAVKPYAYLEM